MTGRIIKGVREFFDVYIEDGKFAGQIIRCNSKGVFRFERGSIRPLVGDAVDVALNRDVADVGITAKNKAEALGRIEKIHGRRNFLVRPPIANLDILFIVAAVKAPAPAYYFIDKLTACAIYNKIEPVIIANKIDLLGDGEACGLYDIYSRAGFRTVRMSAVAEGEAGLDEIRQAMRGMTCAFAGVSGTGKSSILNRLFDGLDLKTGALSEKIARGKHTTRAVELFRHDMDGYAADTPGFSMLDFDYVDVGKNLEKDKRDKDSSYDIIREELVHIFPDLFEYAYDCRYRKCTHLREDGCRVLAAVAEGAVAGSRHESYVELYGYLDKKKV